MEVKHWGPAGWQFMHAITFGYPERPTTADKNHATQFFKSVGYVLPCNKCRAHYNEEVKRNPPKVDSRDALSRWLVEVHNKVNRENGKREWSHDEVRKKHKMKHHDMAKKCTAPPPPVCTREQMIIMLIVVLLASFYVMSYVLKVL